MPQPLSFRDPSDLPLVARRNYRYELRHILLWGVLVGTIEADLASIVVAKTFHASAFLITVVWAIPVVANVLNIIWGVALRGKKRLRAYQLLGFAAVCVLATVSLTPAGPAWGGWVFAAQIALVNFFLSGIITLRTTLWRVNYPASHRGQIAGRIAGVRLAVAAIATAILALAFDRRPDFYAPAYLGASLLALLSLYPLSRMRARGERAELRRTAAARRDALPASGLVHFGRGLREAFGILQTDRLYRGYMLAQFLLGSANFFTGPVLVAVITRDMGFGYFWSALLMIHLPTIVKLIVIPIWTPYFDRVGVLRFRVVTTLFWIANYTALLVGMILLFALPGEMPLPAMACIIVARILFGIAHGGGQIAWNIGHLHFAPAEQTELYMSVHVVLTGLRGLIMPLLGWVAYASLGWGSFVIALGLSIASLFSFRVVASHDPRGVLPAEARAGSEDAATPRTATT